MKRKARLQKRLEARADQLETQLDQIRSVLRAVNPNVPKAYENNSEEYNRLLLVNRRQGIYARQVREACDPRGFNRIVLGQVADVFAAQGEDLALMFNEGMKTGFHAGFGNSRAYQYIAGSRIFEKMVTRTLTQAEYGNAMIKMARYLGPTAAVA